MKRTWDEHDTELDAPMGFKIPDGLSQVQHGAVTKLIQSAFTEGTARMMAVAVAERVVHEMQRVRGILPRFDG
jgi:hypothetical protein